MMEITEGSHAIADAVRLCRPQVVSAYPITPQTHIVEDLADFVANGRLDAEYITVDNELSALSACIGASAAGSRAYSATTSQGLALMFEACFNAAGMRLPIIMSIANRALGAPLSIWNDQQDSIALRDAGWLQFYAEDNQEATDLHFLAYKVAEDVKVQLPVLVCFDGFILSHTYEPIDMLSQEQVDKYLPKFNPAEKLDAKDPISFGMYATPDYYLEFRYEMDQAQKLAKDVIAKAGKEFGTTIVPLWKATSSMMPRRLLLPWDPFAGLSKTLLTKCGQTVKKSGFSRSASSGRSPLRRLQRPSRR
jgi:pyruvate ferredoxin oxidoreductase alpha subunit